MNEAGVAVGINNLTAADGRVGVTWPFVVRKALQQERAIDAIRCVTGADLAGGHSFLVFDRTGAGAVVEAMPTSRHVFELGDAPLVHTNHCLVPETARVEGARPAALQDSSMERLADAETRLTGGTVTFDDLVALTRDERSICRFVAPPFDYESCGAAIMRPATGDFWACWGIPSQNDYEHFTIREAGA
jgi:isopenicillin-N N-acyltransferase-like protein